MLDQTTNHQIEVIGFDLDGTLYPLTSEIQKRIRTKIYENISLEFNIPVEEAEKLFEGLYNSEGLEYSHSGSRTIKEISRRLGEDKDGEGIVDKSIAEADILNFIEKNSKLVELLDILYKKYSLDLVTNSSKELAYKKLEKIGINPSIFKNILTSEDGKSKSDGSKFQNWLEIRKVSPDKILYIGDNKKQDIIPNRELGIKTCGIDEKGDLNKVADFSIKNILELGRLFS